ncbi:hypothetical protein M407DRAFT_34944 [Tulasnella calospora MUT 4182]|uniref:Uncharacterized protein n=1 Tax=Tulasnella calospora MUT 4182 TaxID=1051891 RepID=A0A0C3Q0I8_9AGAM|nr:hypothetical protein M407DRAFT_34944 [Tulasnella calospora MUT 4182]
MLSFKYWVTAVPASYYHSNLVCCLSLAALLGEGLPSDAVYQSAPYSLVAVKAHNRNKPYLTVSIALGLSPPCPDPDRSAV